MDKQDWVSAKKKILNAFDQGMIMIKKGAHGANIVREKTVQAVGLEVELLQLKSRLGKDYQRLGQELAKKILRVVSLKIPPSAKEMAAEIQKLERKISQIESDLKKFTITSTTSTRKKK